MLRVKQWYVGYVLNEMRITQSSRIGYAPILLIFNRSLQKQRAKKADQRISPRRALKAIIANLPPVSVFEIHAATGREVCTSFHPISTIFLPLVAKFLEVFREICLHIKNPYYRYRQYGLTQLFGIQLLINKICSNTIIERHFVAFRRLQ